MKAIVVTDQAAGTAGMTLMERPEPPAARIRTQPDIHVGNAIAGSERAALRLHPPIRGRIVQPFRAKLLSAIHSFQDAFNPNG